MAVGLDVDVASAVHGHHLEDVTRCAAPWDAPDKGRRGLLVIAEQPIGGHGEPFFIEIGTIVLENGDILEVIQAIPDQIQVVVVLRAHGGMEGGSPDHDAHRSRGVA
mgnify:CR=1 FL=1